MKRVVIVAPHFPPSNLAAVHRSRLFATHLHKFGWQAQVLTVQPQYYEEALDPELERLVPSTVPIRRTRALRTRPLRVIGDIGIRAFWWHYRELLRLCRRGDVDLVYIPIPPNYSAMLGPLVYRKTMVPYAIDLIDPWLHTWPGSNVRWSKAWASRHLARFLEPIALRDAALVTAVAPGYYDGALHRYPWLDPARCVAMPYGGDPAEFAFLDQHPRRPWLFDPADGKLHVIYAGAMLPRAYSTLCALLQALRSVIDSPELARLRFHFVGTGGSSTDLDGFRVLPWAQQYGLTPFVDEHPTRIPYLEVLNHLKHAHAVLVLGSSEPHYTASKVFQAVLSRKPVLGLLHRQSTAADLLRTLKAGPLVTFDRASPASHQVDAIARALREVVTWDQQNRHITDWKVFEPYSAEAVTGRLAAAFDAALS
jgi:hypothetical protein